MELPNTLSRTFRLPWAARRSTCLGRRDRRRRHHHRSVGEDRSGRVRSLTERFGRSQSSRPFVPPRPWGVSRAKKDSTLTSGTRSRTRFAALSLGPEGQDRPLRNRPSEDEPGTRAPVHRSYRHRARSRDWTHRETGVRRTPGCRSRSGPPRTRSTTRSRPCRPCCSRRSGGRVWPATITRRAWACPVVSSSCRSAARPPR